MQYPSPFRAAAARLAQSHLGEQSLEDEVESVEEAELSPVEFLAMIDSELNSKMPTQIPLCAGFAKATDCTDKLFDISTEDLNYGQEQVRRMVRDRPTMAAFLKSSDPVWNWCARQFAGEFTGSRYTWDANQVEKDGALAWHIEAADGRPGAITVGQKWNMGSGGEEHLAAAIFELFNIRNDEEFLSYHKAAWFGQIGRDDSVTKITRLEFFAAKKQARFFKDFWLPHAKDMHLDIEPYGQCWGATLPRTYEAWIKSIPKDSTYLKHYWNDR
jgi:hypothetical protein